MDRPILNLTSIGGQVSIGGFALYCATEFAVEGFSEGLRDELAPLGVRITLVEPGAFCTSFAEDANMRPAATIDAYQGVIAPIRQYLYGSDGQQPVDPHKAAQAMIDVVESDDPPLRLILGADAYEAWDKRNEAMTAELTRWRAMGEATAIDGVAIRSIGG